MRDHPVAHHWHQLLKLDAVSIRQQYCPLPVLRGKSLQELCPKEQVLRRRPTPRAQATQIIQIDAHRLTNLQPASSEASIGFLPYCDSNAPFTTSHWEASETRRAWYTWAALPSSKKSTTSHCWTFLSVHLRSKSSSHWDTSSVPWQLNLERDLCKRPSCLHQNAVKFGHIDHGRTWRRVSTSSKCWLLLALCYGLDSLLHACRQADAVFQNYQTYSQSTCEGSKASPTPTHISRDASPHSCSYTTANSFWGQPSWHTKATKTIRAYLNHDKVHLTKSTNTGRLERSVTQPVPTNAESGMPDCSRQATNLGQKWRQTN